VEKLGIEELQPARWRCCASTTFCGNGAGAAKGRIFPWPAVSTGFPADFHRLRIAIAEIRRSVEAGAREIDVVITRAQCVWREVSALYD